MSAEVLKYFRLHIEIDQDDATTATTATMTRPWYDIVPRITFLRCGISLAQRDQ